jgi:hypothetical protein
MAAPQTNMIQNSESAAHSRKKLRLQLRFPIRPPFGRGPAQFFCQQIELNL